MSMPERAPRPDARLRAERPSAAVAQAGWWLPGLWADDDPRNRHSRFVALLRRVLPAIGVGLLLLIAIWPRLAPLWERMRFAFPAIDLRDARELDMINPRYAGLDREGRPFVVTAVSARQLPDRQDLVSLKSPRADMKTHSGANVVITALTGIYQSQTQLLDMFDDVTLVHQNGTRFVTQSARVNAVNNSAQGDKPIEGHGPSGDVQAEGFRISDRGDKILFTGKADLLLRGNQPGVPNALPGAAAGPVAGNGAPAKPVFAAAHTETPRIVPAVARRPVAPPHAARGTSRHQLHPVPTAQRKS